MFYGNCIKAEEVRTQSLCADNYNGATLSLLQTSYRTSGEPYVKQGEIVEILSCFLCCFLCMLTKCQRNEWRGVVSWPPGHLPCIRPWFFIACNYSTYIICWLAAWHSGKWASCGHQSNSRKYYSIKSNKEQRTASLCICSHISKMKI